MAAQSHAHRHPHTPAQYLNSLCARQNLAGSRENNESVPFLIRCCRGRTRCLPADGCQRRDNAVSDAYGWLYDLSDEAILKRVLALNLEQAAMQSNGGLAAGADEIEAEDQE